jgi:hypothetical protein
METSIHDIELLRLGIPSTIGQPIEFDKEAVSQYNHQPINLTTGTIIEERVAGYLVRTKNAIVFVNRRDALGFAI